MRFHVPGLPWAEFTKDYTTCAYTFKVVKFAKMMMAHGHEVILYGGERNETPCTEHFQVVTQAERKQWFGGGWDKQHLFTGITWDETHPCWRTMNERVILKIQQQCVDSKDFICCLAGCCQMQIAQAFPGMIVCEPFIGYEGIFSKFHAFESYAWMHYLYGKQNRPNGEWYDTVIHAYADKDDFPHLNTGKGDYLLFLGRLVQRKGLEVASQIAERTGIPLKIAGPGATLSRPGMLQSGEVTITGNHFEYLGAVGPQQRAELMADARAVLMPTYYIEPGGNVAAETAMCGTPLICTDWGCMTEQVVDGETGFRFRTLKEGIAAVEQASNLNAGTIRQHALDNFSLEATYPKFERWFRNLNSLWTENWDGTPLASMPK